MQLGAPVLEVCGLSQPGMVKDIAFSLRAGEVLGISGLMGAGRSELARILFGVDPFESGEIRICGTPVAAPTPAACMAHGMAFLTEDRRAEGLMMEASIADNVALASLPEFGRTWLRFIDRTRLGDEVARVSVRGAHQRPRPAAHAGEEPVRRQPAEGGDRQVAGLHDPRVLSSFSTSRRAASTSAPRYEVYKIINQLAAAGTGVLFISSEIEELTGMCDRILVMAHGEIRAEFDRDAFDREAILRTAMWHGIREPA